MGALQSRVPDHFLSFERGTIHLIGPGFFKFLPLQLKLFQTVSGLVGDLALEGGPDVADDDGNKDFLFAELFWNPDQFLLHIADKDEAAAVFQGIDPSFLHLS